MTDQDEVVAIVDFININNQEDQIIIYIYKYNFKIKNNNLEYISNEDHKLYKLNNIINFNIQYHHDLMI